MANAASQLTSKIKCGKGSARLGKMWGYRGRWQFPVFETCPDGIVSQLQQKLAFFPGEFIPLGIAGPTGNARTGSSLVR